MYWFLILVLCWGAVEASNAPCYPPGGVAGIVVATVIVTCVAGGLGAALAWKFWWIPRRERASGNKRTDNGLHQKNSSDFAFDNPYFRNQETVDDIDGTGKSKLSIGNKNSLRSSKQSATKSKKGRSGKNHFGGGKKQKALDDSCITALEPERTFVSLRGHDFTGLGFNICGNMRDGIMVKDVLHRGPASESGLIKAGDKIINVTVSFTNIVYEDALTILSYASPYDVQLEIERIPEKARIPPTGSKRLGSCSFSNSGQKLFHPLYRSQSIDDLTQIDRDTLPSQGPKRSQSVGVAAHTHLKNSDSKLEERERGPVSSLLLSGSLNEKMLANVMSSTEGNLQKSKGLQWEKRFEDTLDDDTEKSVASSKSEGKQTTVADVSREERLSGYSNRDGFSVNASSNTSRRGDEANDSDVSRDSLELSHKSYQKNKTTTSDRKLSVGSSESPVSKKFYSQKKDNAPSPGMSKDKGRSEKIYVKDRKSERIHSSSLSSNDEQPQGQGKTIYSKTTRRDSDDNDSVDYGRDRDNQTKPPPVFRNVQKSVVCSPYDERQKQIYSEAQNPCVSRIKVNGGLDSVKSQNQQLPYGYHAEMDNRNLESETKLAESVSIQEQRLMKKAALNPAGGMFTQINPFQMASKQKNTTFKPWAERDDLSKHQVSSANGQTRPGYSDSSGPKLTLKDSSIKHRMF